MLQRPLTEKQEEVLEWVQTYAEEKGDFPSFRTIMDGLGFQSPTSVTQHLKALERKGYLVNRAGQWDFAKEHYFISDRKRNELRDLFSGLLKRYEAALRELGRDEELIRLMRNDYMNSFNTIMFAE